MSVFETTEAIEREQTWSVLMVRAMKKHGAIVA